MRTHPVFMRTHPVFMRTHPVFLTPVLLLLPVTLLTESQRMGEQGRGGMLQPPDSGSQSHRDCYRDGQARGWGFQTKGDPEWSPERIREWESSENPGEE